MKLIYIKILGGRQCDLYLQKRKLILGEAKQLFSHIEAFNHSSAVQKPQNLVQPHTLLEYYQYSHVIPTIRNGYLFIFFQIIDLNNNCRKYGTLAIIIIIILLRKRKSLTRHVTFAGIFIFLLQWINALYKCIKINLKK